MLAERSELLTVERVFAWDRGDGAGAWAVVVTWTGEQRAGELVWSPTRVAVDGGGVPLAGTEISAAPVAEAIEATAPRVWPLDSTAATPLGEIWEQLGVRAYNILMRAGIDTVEKLTATSQERIGELPRMGPQTRQQITRALAHYWQATGR
ncbi:DNA-directed RNA polymerase subunit alpha C-terminal domain-containing protein [Catellatospora sp. NPDC049111]|uniref:DNA-directed RNA polymerase subunit alpha C-terminal domain-containing protein n=1 Tax=Catellatospora sp. NPDC049111 TaxID=3155271 RepID=UPI0033CABA53